MNGIPLGAKGSFSMIVAPEHLASRFKDPTLPPVLATPLMILFMENAVLSAIRDYMARARHSRQRQAPSGDAGRTAGDGGTGRHRRRKSTNRLRSDCAR